jgi:hypothetical protein
METDPMHNPHCEPASPPSFAQVRRLVGLACNFEKAVSILPDGGQKYIQAQQDVAAKHRRAQSNPALLDMRLD